MVGPRAVPAKPLAARLGEWLLCYFLVGGLALLLEKRAGQIAPQGWEFYAVTVALFATLAFSRLRLPLPAAPQGLMAGRMRPVPSPPHVNVTPRTSLHHHEGA